MLRLVNPRYVTRYTGSTELIHPSRIVFVCHKLPIFLYIFEKYLLIENAGTTSVDLVNRHSLVLKHTTQHAGVSQNRELVQSLLSIVNALQFANDYVPNVMLPQQFLCPSQVSAGVHLLNLIGPVGNLEPVRPPLLLLVPGPAQYSGQPGIVGDSSGPPVLLPMGFQDHRRAFHIVL